MIDNDGQCPHDPGFVHRFYYGCTPTDFSPTTGRSKTHRQRRGADGRYHWDGGCDARKLRGEAS